MRTQTIEIANGPAVLPHRDLLPKPFRAPHYSAGTVGFAHETWIAAGGTLWLERSDKLSRNTIEQLASQLAAKDRPMPQRIMLSWPDWKPLDEDDAKDLERARTRVREICTLLTQAHTTGEVPR